MRAFIGLGSNLDDPHEQIGRAFAELAQIPNTLLRARSSLYQSTAVGPGDQPDYINAVAEVSTELSPLALLDALQTIERAHHRERKVHWGPRTLDLDILLLDNLQIDSERLKVPHPYLEERNFVLHPLWEIAPTLILPNGRRLDDLVAHCVPQGLIRLI